MKIFGIDQSKTCTAITELSLQNNIITDVKHYFTTTVKKQREQLCDNIIPILLKDKSTGFYKTKQICDEIEKILSTCSADDHFGMEGGAFAASGQLFDLGELSGIIKWIVLKKDLKLYSFSPNTIKKYATGKGSGKKEQIYLAYKKQFPHSNILKYYCNIDDNLFIETQLKNKGTPLCDLIDSHFIALKVKEELDNG